MSLSSRRHARAAPRTLRESFQRDHLSAAVRRRSNCVWLAFVVEPGRVGQKLAAAKACSKIA
jgi:hypothetical protein